MKSLYALLLAIPVAIFSAIALADSSDRPDNGQGGGNKSREAVAADFIPMLPTKGKGDGQYFAFSGKRGTALNADVRLALEKLDESGNILAVLNTHLGITTDNYGDAVITLFIGTDEDGDGTCLSEGPTSICVLESGGSQDLEVNPDGILHAAWAMALREHKDRLKGSGTCWTDFDSTEVTPQFDDDGNMTSVVFAIEGGVEAMPEIRDGDGSVVGFGAPWLMEGLDCGANATCEVIPIMTGLWED